MYTSNTPRPRRTLSEIRAARRATFTALLASKAADIEVDAAYEVWRDACNTGVLHPERLEQALQYLSDHDAYRLELIEENYSIAANPLFVWEAIDYCHLPPRARLFDQFPRETMGDDQDWLLRLMTSCPTMLPYPAWCQNYLGTVAKGITDLGKIPNAKMPVGKKGEEVKRIFGFCGKGWNAFREVESLLKGQSIMSHAEELHLGRGYSYTKICQLFKQALNLNDDRNLKRKVSGRTRKSSRKGGQT